MSKEDAMVIISINLTWLFKDFNAEFNIGKRDLLVTNEWMYTPYVAPLGLETNVHQLRE